MAFARFTLVIVIASSLLVSAVTAITASEQLRRTSEEVIISQQEKLDLISSRMQLRLDHAKRILEITSSQPEARHSEFSNLISHDLKGIPQDADLAKRKLASDIVNGYPDFEYVFFAMPNGDIYLLEPYAEQIKLTGLNFAFRDWYKGAIETRDTYVSEVYVSAATGHNVAAISVPVYSPDSNLVGFWVGALDLHVVEENLINISLGINEYVALIDHKGNIIADTIGGQPEDIPIGVYLDSTSGALKGEKGTSTGQIDDKRIFFAFSPSIVGSHVWAVISAQPFDDAFYLVNTLTIQSFIATVLVMAISSVSGYILYRSSRFNMMLAKSLETANRALHQQTRRLSDADKEKEEFSAMVTHELRTPLVPVIGYSELLLDGTIGQLTEKQRETIQIINTSATSLLRLISDLLDARKLEMGKMKFEKRSSDARALVYQCVAALKPLAKFKGITITTNAQGLNENILVTCDSKRIRQVLDNLVNNAIKFSPSDTGKIELTVQVEDRRGTVVFAVRDNGAGIPKDKQEKIFQKFYQADTSMTRNAGGTGLGLAISKAIVEAHDGRIWFESEPGAGTTFFFSIPPTMTESSPDNLKSGASVS